MSRLRALVDGRWYSTLSPNDPRVQRLRQRPTTWREWITHDGSRGPQDQPARPAERGRYHLYVSHACPWAHRTILYRSLLGLENVVSMSVLHPRMAGPASWTFEESRYSTVDHLHGCGYLHEVYTLGHERATTVVTVPMLWDRATGTIVNRESGDIIRILEDGFRDHARTPASFRPPGCEEEVERMNEFVLSRVCTAVYRVGFARDQASYDRELVLLFSALDDLEKRLSRQPFLLGDVVTESDWHLFATLVRFDCAYHGALRCSLRRLVDYPFLAEYTHRLYQLPGVADTVDFDAIRMHYFDDHPEIVRTIVPPSPTVEFRAPPSLRSNPLTSQA